MPDDLNAVWTDVLRVLENELSRPSFDAWLRSSTPLSLSDDTLVVEVPHEFARDWLESRYSALLSEVLRSLSGRDIRIRFVARRGSNQSSETNREKQTFGNESAGAGYENSPAVHTAPEGFSGTSGASSADSYSGSSAAMHSRPSTGSSSGSSVPGRASASSGVQGQKNSPESRSMDEVPDAILNPKYTFESFVVGNSNHFANAAALAVSDAPGKAYNPLFIYGGVGLGKTHLMQAIGHHVLGQNSSARVVYVPCEQFTNDLIHAIRYDRTVEFRGRYRSVDLLMIDDIQFLAGKERTQEEFFHTFNTLYEAGKQIVISSDRPPKEIATLESRLRSRFEWGLITDIQAPDLETRIAILKKKAASEQMDVPNDALVYVAGQIHSNIRELEGALIRVTAFAALNNREITPQLAAEVLKDMLPSSRPKQISVELIQRTVADYYSLEVSEMRARSRVRTVSMPRQVAMYLCRELTELSLPKIGEGFGGRDHTTVIHACEKIQQDIKADQALSLTVKEIIARLQNG
ncbi:MAG: chromosomal replication initiator protein DnaA [Clostridia bacterium]|nr:chromosomal replication initiator protein DnaA [Clostridia bacterium]